jgi:hypothetical protein
VFMVAQGFYVSRYLEPDPVNETKP